MGRLAGPIKDAWKKQVQEQRRQKAQPVRRVILAAPIVHPPAKRRLMALLWLIGEYGNGNMLVGFSGSPPLTRDMKTLMAAGYLKMSRDPSMVETPHGLVRTSRLQRVNLLSITTCGRGALGSADVSDQDMQYIIAARRSAALR